MAQAWLDRRLSGLTPNSFAEGIVIFGFQLQPPRDFGGSWCELCCHSGIRRPDNFDALGAILIFASPFQEDHVEGIRNIVMAAASWAVGDAGGPVLLWVPHTVAPDEQAPGMSVDVYRDKFVVDLMGLGLDGVIAEEPEGFELVLAVRLQMQRTQTLLKAFNLTILEQHKRKSDLEFYQDCIEKSQWDFVREKLGSQIPPSDPTLDQGRAVPGYALGRLLATRRTGATYLLEPAAPEGGGGAAAAGAGLEVVKVIDKSTITHVEDLKRLSRHIDIMQLLSGERWRHPNLARLNQVYHSRTKILFRMDYGGSVVLSLWLRERHKPNATKSLAVADVAEICRQLLTVVADLHAGPQVCHLDIKPENVILDGASPIGLKLVEFDCAQVQAGGELCRGACGTLPFIAPEVLLMEEYDGMAADVWSLGVMLFEVHCGYDGTEKLLNAPLRQHPAVRACAVDSTRNKIIGACIKVRFAQTEFAGRMTGLHGHPDLGALLPAMQPLLNGMCDLDPGRRLSARQALDVMTASLAAVAPGAGPS